MKKSRKETLLEQVRNWPEFDAFCDVIRHHGCFSRSSGKTWVDEGKTKMNALSSTSICLTTDVESIIIWQPRTQEYPGGNPQKVSMLEFCRVHEFPEELANSETLLGQTIRCIFRGHGFFFDEKTGIFEKIGVHVEKKKG